jgi:hypothetical protein
VIEVAANIVVFMIRGLPPLARQMAAKVQDRSISSARRCAAAGVLAYFVQPHDLIADDAPGGYGFLDDTILVRAGMLEYLNLVASPGGSADSERNMLGMLAGLTPAPVRPALQQMVTTMAAGVQILGMLEGPIAEMILAQIIANPLQPVGPPAPHGFAPRPPASLDRGRWSSGAYFEGNNVVIPGGPSLINGELFIP